MMRYSVIANFTKLGILLCALSLGLAACDSEQQGATGLEVEEREIERENGQIEEAEIEVEREQLEEIDRAAGDELAGVTGQQQGQQALGEQQGQQALGEQQGQQAQDLTAVFTAPVDFVGVPATGTATVADVISDRGFWLTDGQNRLFAVVKEAKEHQEKVHIKEGQRIQLTGIMMAPGDPTDVQGGLEPQAQKVADQQNKLVVASWKDIQIVQQPGQGAVGGGPGQQDQQKQKDQQNQQ